MFHGFRISESGSLIISIACLPCIYRTVYLYVMPYLLVMNLAECLGQYALDHHDRIMNLRVYNIFFFLEFLFFFYLFFRSLTIPALKRVVVVFSVFLTVFFAADILFIQGFSIFNSYTTIAGSLLIIILVFMYYFDLFERNDTVTLTSDPMFWISIGLFFFYLGNLAFFLMYTYFSTTMLNSARNLFSNTNHALIIFEYVCFSVALIVCSRNNIKLKRQLV